MLDLVKNMEPRYENENTILFAEVEEVTEVIFFVEGIFEIGFEMNGKQHFVLRF